LKALILIPAPLKDKGLSALVADYLKRAAPTFPCELKILKGERIPAKEAPAPYLEKEAKKIRDATPQGFFTVAMQPNGKVFSSHDFSEKLQKLADRGVRGVAFWVGSAYGLAPGLVKEADLSLSMSPMTFPHQLAVVMLAEQLYRAHAIQKGTPYHK